MDGLDLGLRRRVAQHGCADPLGLRPLQSKSLFRNRFIPPFRGKFRGLSSFRFFSGRLILHQQSGMRRHAQPMGHVGLFQDSTPRQPQSTDARPPGHHEMEVQFGLLDSVRFHRELEQSEAIDACRPQRNRLRVFRPIELKTLVRFNQDRLRSPAARIDSKTHIQPNLFGRDAQPTKLFHGGRCRAGGRVPPDD